MEVKGIEQRRGQLSSTHGGGGPESLEPSQAGGGGKRKDDWPVEKLGTGKVVERRGTVPNIHKLRVSTTRTKEGSPKVEQ